MTPQQQLLKSLYIMASMVEARDPYTGGHLWRVAQLAQLLAQAGGWKVADVARVKLGGFLHDLGKIGVPDAILNKPDRLTEAEFAVIRTHPEVGHRLLAEHPLAALVSASVLCHHETVNGQGYPQQLRGDAIPLDARIVGVCDAYDAMTSTRPYRRGMPISRALDIIESALGQQFDAHWGRLLVTLGRAGRLDAITGHSDHGIPLQDCPMCGPTIVVQRHQHTGDNTYCRACGAHATIEKSPSGISLKFSGEKGDARALQASLDMALINEQVQDVSPALGTNEALS